MKKILYFAVMALFLAGMTACEKDEPDNNGGNGGNGGGGVTGGPLVGTEWVYSETETETEDGMTYSYVVDVTVKFTSGSNGKMVINAVGYANGTQMYTDSDEDPFTYTYEGTATQGRGTMTGTDAETGESSSLPFTIAGNELTITGVDEETGETETIVFTRK
ncbi:MAG: hypothetical protein K5918_07040 [Bacteroidales bacterium]|nr:hypothetical protein [Bacteroidales bacterium]